jgi:hypothetical protein
MTRGTDLAELLTQPRGTLVEAQDLAWRILEAILLGPSGDMDDDEAEAA